MIRSERNQMRIAVIVWIVVLVLFTAPADGKETIVKIGQGGYSLTPPPDTKQPPATAFRTDNLRGPVPTYDWCSSLVFAKYSECHYPHPLVVRATPNWLHKLDALGRIDHTSTANHSLHAIFCELAKTTYVVHNMSGKRLSVTFSDGTTISAAKRGTTAETRLTGKERKP